MADFQGDGMDIDIDLGEEPDMTQYETEEMVQVEQPVAVEEGEVGGVANAIPEAYNDDFDANMPAREKVHLRGLDSFNPEELKQYLFDHYSANPHRRIEWVNDTSANIIYHHPDHAREALISLSEIQDPNLPTTEMRPAKKLSTRPDVELFVRQAMMSDKKIQNARLYSKFYLNNPDYDPELREYNPRYNRRGRGGMRDGGRREREPAPKAFNVDMYDDNAGDNSDVDIGQQLRQSSKHDSPPRKRRYENVDLFEGKSNGRLRDRSRSPYRDGDGRYGFDDEQPQRKTARRRSRTPPQRRRQPDRDVANVPKELFPSRAPQSTETLLSASNKGIELVPNHASKRSRELFPNRTPHSNHRRSDALDNHETAGIISSPSRSLADRITGGPAEAGFSFKGAAEAPGISIRGAAREINPKVKELFPMKAGNNMGKELFPAGSRGKGGQRRRAEELL